MRTYDLKTLRELYRVDNKYWKTGDTDILPKRLDLAKQVDKDFWSEISAITSIATRTHKSVQDLVNALSALGFEIEEVELDEAD